MNIQIINLYKPESIVGLIVFKLLIHFERNQTAVLLACETGMGDIMNGEGVYGLQRALKQAGDSKMIVCLWPVPYIEISEMMQLFYMQLSKGLPIAASFRKALEQMRKKYPLSPARWGALNLVE